MGSRQTIGRAPARSALRGAHRLLISSRAQVLAGQVMSVIACSEVTAGEYPQANIEEAAGKEQFHVYAGELLCETPLMCAENCTCVETPGTQTLAAKSDACRRRCRLTW